MFISKAFGGRDSDKFIVEKSGFMNYLLPGDKIMADRGFTIEDLLFPLRVKLNIPWPTSFLYFQVLTTRLIKASQGLSSLSLTLMPYMIVWLCYL